MSGLPYYIIALLVAPTLTSILLNLVMYIIYFAPRKESVQSFRIGFGKVWRRFKLPIIKCPIEICNWPIIKSDLILEDDSSFYHKSKQIERSVALIMTYRVVTFLVMLLGFPILCYFFKGDEFFVIFVLLIFIFVLAALVLFIPAIWLGLYIMASEIIRLFKNFLPHQFSDISFGSIIYFFSGQITSETIWESILWYFLFYMLILIKLIIGYATLSLFTVFPSTLGGKLILPLFDAMPKVGEAPSKRIIRRNAAVISILIYIGLLVFFILYFDI